MHAATRFIGTVETALGHDVAPGHVVAVIRKDFARPEHRGFAYDLIALDDLATAVMPGQDPLTPQQGDGVFGGVLNGDKIDKCVRLVGGQAFAAVVINEFIETSGETG